MPRLILMQPALLVRVARVIRLTVREIPLQVEPQKRRFRQCLMFEVEPDIKNPDPDRRSLIPELFDRLPGLR